MPVRALLVGSLALFSMLVACGDDGGAEPGKELGPCVQEQFCENPLVCTEGVCVHPDQIGGTGEVSAGEGGSHSGGTSTTGDSSPGSAGEGPVTGSNDDGGAEIYCSQGETEACFCGHTADYGPPGAPCSESTVQSPAKCCASEGWPAYGGCSCWTQSCRWISSETCFCGLGSPDPEDGDEPVSSCSAPEGVCCADDDGATCNCWTSISTCLEGSHQVSSCSVESLHCGSNSQLSACN